MDVIVLCRVVWRERWSIDRNLTWRRIKEARQKGWREEGKNLKTLCLGDAILSFLAPATVERTPRSTYFKWQKASLFRAPRFIPPPPTSPPLPPRYAPLFLTLITPIRATKKKRKRKRKSLSSVAPSQSRKNHPPRDRAICFRYVSNPLNFSPLPPFPSSS